MMIRQLKVQQLSDLFNSITGYTQIQKYKDRVDVRDKQLTDYKQNLSASKANYEEIIERRRKISAQINGLLQRKDTWTDLDVTAFTELYRSDLNLEQEELISKTKYKEAGDAFDRAHLDYLKYSYPQLI
jgi:sensitive to high expression protein 9